MKRLLFILTLLFTSWQCASAYDFMYDQIAYNFNSDNKSLTVTYTLHQSPNNYSGLTRAYIPSALKINGSIYYVTNIDNDAFSRCSTLTNVTIPYTVTSIGASSFWGCSKLSSVTIPNSVISIGNQAFQYCYGLTSLTIPNSVTSIGESSFYQCKGLTSITIGTSVASIGKNAFEECYGLEIVEYNAVDCAGPTSDKDIWFKNSKFKTLVIGDEVKSIPSYLAYYQSKLTDVTIGNSVTSIGNSAFFYCSGLEFITIPYSVTNIGDGVFYYCSGLKIVFSENSTPPTISTYSFSSSICREASLVVPTGSKENYSDATGWQNFKNIKEVGSYDINEDGTVDVCDINILINIITGDIPSAIYKGLADVNNDGKIDVSDINTIINVLLD